MVGGFPKHRPRGAALYAVLLAMACLAGLMRLGVGSAEAQTQGPSAAERFSHSYALVIGIDQYKADDGTGGWPNLRNAVKDAELIGRELARHGYETTLVRNPDYAALHRAFDDFFFQKGADPNARLLVWFSGHGETLPREESEPNKREGYLVPRGAPASYTDWRFRQNVISLRTFDRWMREARARHVLAIFDSCFSGSVFHSVRGTLTPKLVDSLDSKVRQLISSGSAGEVVADDGAFRNLVLDVLAGRRPEPVRDGHVLGSDLAQFLSTAITNESAAKGRKQTPQHGKLDSYGGGDFVFTVLPEGTSIAPRPPAPERPKRPRAWFDDLFDRLGDLSDLVAREQAALQDRPAGAFGLAVVGLLLVAGILYVRNDRVLWKLEAPGLAELVDQTRWKALSASRYRERLKSWLDWMDARLGPHPFGPGAYNVLFRLAVMYPVAGVLLVWLMTGENTSGIPRLLPEVDGRSRLFAGACLPIIGMCTWRIWKDDGWRSYLWSATLFALLWFGGQLFEIAGIGVAPLVLAGVVFLGAVANPALIVVMLAFSAAIAHSGALWAASLAYSGTTTGITIGPFMLVSDFTTALFYTLLGAFFMAFTLALFLLQQLMASRGKAASGHGLIWLLLTAICVILAYKASPLRFTSGSRSFLVFLAALPLVNVIFDWLSLGVTRALLAESTRGLNAWRNGLLDLLAAVTLLFGLAVTATAALQGLNTLAFLGGASEPLLDLAGLLSILRTRPGDPAVWWVYFMLFSTLVPSIVHLFIAAGSLFTLSLPRRWLASHAEDLATGYAGTRIKRRRIAWFLTLRQIAATLIVAIGVGGVAAIMWGLRLGLPQLAGLLLWTAETTAAALGAPVKPVLIAWW